jgi:LPS-assembly protein
LSLCLSAVQQTYAQGVCLAVAAPLPESEIPVAPPSEQLDISAGRFEVSGDQGAEFSGQIEVRFRDGILSAERASYDRDNESLQVIGRVTLRNPDMVVFAEDARMDTETEELFFGSAGFDLPNRPARGSAQQISIQGDDTVSLSSVFFTTCPEDQLAWDLQAKQLDFDIENGFGTARGVRLNFKGVPILYTPYFTFPIDNQRKSGFLTPQIADRDRTGLDVTVPYYLNLAPNYDLTLEPRYLSQRGVQMNGDFRYLMPSSEGQLGIEFLPDDDQLGETRRYFNLQHESYFGQGWRLLAGLEEVSDEAYFEDLGESLSITSQTHLNRYVDLAYSAPRWSLLTRFQNYQTIDTFIAPEDRPYERVPQMLFEGAWTGDLVGFTSNTELVNFDREIGTTGWRLDLTQELSLRFARAGMYLTPAVAIRQTNYWLDNTVPGADETPSRSVPIGSVDTGLKFERTAGGARWIQTLEPRLLYVNVPFEDQSALPVFDTILPDFNLIQLFRKYQFVGPDRIGDTDQLSFGLTTRLIDANSGRERLAATLGQTRYLSPQEVTLPGGIPSGISESDYVAELSMGLSDMWNLALGYQWNSETDSTARAESRFEFRPQADRVFGFGYRYRRGALEQGDLSLVWPIGDRWRFIGSYSYSLLEKEPLEQFVGWEFEACCWRVRVISRRYVSRRTGESDSAVSIQFELKGLSQGASSPEELLDRGILGYRRIDGTNAQ